MHHSPPGLVSDFPSDLEPRRPGKLMALGAIACALYVGHGILEARGVLPVSDHGNPFAPQESSHFT